MNKKLSDPTKRPGLPRQHVHAVVELPPCPEDFYIETPIGADPAPFFARIEHEDTLKTVCVLEWAWSRTHARLDFYQLEKRPLDWVLWNNVPAGVVDDKHHQALMAHTVGFNEPENVAAIHLLRASLATDREYRGIDRPHAIIHAGLLSVAELAAVFREVWPDEQ